VRESQRAKHVSIRISRQGEVEIVVPPRFDRSRLPEILNQRQDWITRTLKKLEWEQQQSVQDPPLAVDGQGLPTTITFCSTGATWQVSYQQTDAPHLAYSIPTPQHLAIQGQTQNTSLCKRALQQWLRHQAEIYLIPWLREVSAAVGLPCSRISVRRQKTLWGSCSHQKNISLNDKLMFLPPEIVRYVLIHELCHTVYMNHSPQFWALVGQHDPQYRQHDKALNQAWQYIPNWLNE
jgi:predicted metal-dependent hydrolase